MKERPILPFGLGIVMLVGAAWSACDLEDLAEPIAVVQPADRVELSGVVADANRMAIPYATVRVNDLVTVADDGGRYTLLVRRGYVGIEASAPGYATARRTGAGAVDLVLVPEATLGGTVVDATGTPVAGVRVFARATGPDANNVADPEPVVTDAQGKFQLTRLAPSSFAVTARASHGLATRERTMALAEHVSDLVLPLARAHQVSGRVVIEPRNATCHDGGFMLHDETHDRWVDIEHLADGTLRADGVLPGTYTVTAWCQGHVSRERYPSLTVTHDVGGLIWPVTRGVELRGRVISQHGAPITDASVTATELDGRGYAREQVTAGGAYVLRGLSPGRYRIKTARPHSFGTVPAVEAEFVVELPRDTERELILPDTSGTLTGRIVTADNTELPAAYIIATPADPNAWSGRVRADDAGGFELENIPPGEYQIAVEGRASKPQKLEVRTGHTTVARVVVSDR